jgi:hypothetical protein
MLSTALPRTKPVPWVRNAFTVLIASNTKSASDIRGILTIVLVFGATEYGIKKQPNSTAVNLRIRIAKICHWKLALGNQ